MNYALYGELYQEPIRDRDGYDCGTRTEAYYICLRGDGTVHCFEEARVHRSADSLPSPTALGRYSLSGEDLTLELERTADDEHPPMETMHDTYGPLEPLDVVFTTGKCECKVSPSAIRALGRVFALVDGDAVFLRSHA